MKEVHDEGSKSFLVLPTSYVTYGRSDSLWWQYSTLRPQQVQVTLSEFKIASSVTASLQEHRITLLSPTTERSHTNS